MSLVMQLSKFLPAVSSPKHDQTFKEKLTWTGAVLLIYFVLGQILVYGASQGQIAQFQQLQVVLGSQIGTLITLGIGPIVTASIILQLLVGAEILPWDTNTKEGKQRFQAGQKLLTYFFAIFEAFAFVGMGAIAPCSPGSAGCPALPPSFLFILVVGQVAIGGIFIIMMDEVVKKWGFGSGVSLFILAGVAQTMIIQIISPFTNEGILWYLPEATAAPAGVIFQVLTGELQAQAIIGLAATILVFLMAVYAQAMRVEIPLTFGNMRGFGQKWPLKFVYTNVIPVIFVGAILSNMQLVGSMLANPQQAGIELAINIPWGGDFFLVHSSYAGQGAPRPNTLLYYFSAPSDFMTNIVNTVRTMSLQIPVYQFIQVFVYTVFYIVASAIFSIFWMRTSGQDPHSVAQQISNIGMKIPGHRKDIRVIEKILHRYIPPLAVLGGAFVGFLAAVANWTNAYGSGTGILLAVMIAYQLYEELAKKHMEDMHPAFRKFMGKMEG